MVSANANAADAELAELLAVLAPWGQEHLVAWWNELTPPQRTDLATEIRAVDFELVQKLVRSQHQTDDVAALIARAEPPEAFRLETSRNAIPPEAARAAGEAALRAGTVGVLLVAGGQGSRLGFEHPKGMFPVGPVSGATLFQLLLEQIVALSRRHGVRIPLFLMTSSATHLETVEYLDRVERFGLPADDLFVFMQGAMPAVDQQSGELLLSEKGRLALSPDGHGGMLAALRSSGGLTDLRGRGIEQIFYLQIDNPLVRIGAPEFLGYHLLTQSQASTLAVAKNDARDKVGNLVQVDGRMRIVEYSEFNQLDLGLSDRRDARGGLAFWAGNTAVHVFDAAFLERMAVDAGQLPFHIAHKKVPYIDRAGVLIEPREVNALKFERFIFDLLPAAERALAVECDQRDEFAPVKNASGSTSDSPETVQAQIVDLHSRWLRAAGVTIEPGVPVEISPLFALDEAEVRRKVSPGTTVKEPTYFR